MDYKPLAGELLDTAAELAKAPELRFINRMSSGEMFVLGYLLNNGGVTACRIASDMEISSARVAKLIASLLGKGFIHGERDKTDKRKNNIVLTKQGKEHFTKKMEELTSLTGVLLEKLGEEDTAALIRIAKRIVEIRNEV